MKPKYLFHGSQYKFNIVKPMQAHGKNPIESLKAIYAYEIFELVIPFALPIRWYPDEPGGIRDFTSNSGKTIIKYGSLDPNAIGYVYIFCMIRFIKLKVTNGYQILKLYQLKYMKLRLEIIGIQ